MKNILVLAGHYDDSIIAVGGLLRKFADAGCEVSVVCFGNGDEAFTKVGEQELCKKNSLAEAKEAHKVLGVKHFECLDVPDFAVQENKETYRACIKAIRQYQPEIILGHYWLEYFQHRAMARLTCDSWWQARWNCSADLGGPWTARAMYHYEVIHDLPDPTHIVDVTDTFEAKLEAWKKFVTAQEHLDSMLDQLEARARHHGSRIGVRYAEVLKQSFFVPQTVSEPIKEL